MKYVNNKTEKTNVDSIIGRTAKVVTEIDNVNAKGMVVIDGVEWTARSKDNRVIPKETLVEVVEVSGVKVIVKVK